MPKEIYLVLHVTGFIMVFMALGGAVFHAIQSGEKPLAFRVANAVTHGVGMLLILLGGFGMLAKLGIHWPWPGWIFVKFALWLLLGGLPVLIKRKPDLGRAFWWILILIGITAAYLALFKPF